MVGSNPSGVVCAWNPCRHKCAYANLYVRGMRGNGVAFGTRQQVVVGTGTPYAKVSNAETKAKYPRGVTGITKVCRGRIERGDERPSGGGR